MSEIQDIIRHDFDEKIPVLSFSNDQKLEVYSDMLRIYFMDKYLEQAYKEGKVRGFCHLSLGQECLYAVLKMVMKEDTLVTSYRCHGTAYAAGIPVKEIICECLGTKEGNCKGKGGSMHLYNSKFFGGHGIVGAQVPLGLGLAFAIKYKNYQKKKSELSDDFGKASFISCESPGVCFVLYGDGASNQGQIYESFNMAKIYNLPVVFIVENNKYGKYSPSIKVSVDENYYKRGYGIPGLCLSDKSPENVYSVLNTAKNYAISKGPIIIQIDTHKSFGHGTLDTTHPYFKSEDTEELGTLGSFKDSLDPEEVKQIKEREQKNIKDLVDSIDFSDVLDERDLFTDLYK